MQFFASRTTSHSAMCVTKYLALYCVTGEQFLLFLAGDRLRNRTLTELILKQICMGFGECDCRVQVCINRTIIMGMI